MDCVLKSSDQTIKGRLTHYMFLLVFTASLFMLIVLQFMLESSELSQGVLSVIGDGQDFFDEIIDLQNLTEHILLYDDEQSMETVTQTFHTANEALEMLKQVEAGEAFMRDVLDIEGALHTAQRIIEGMGESGKSSLEFYETDYMKARIAFEWILQERGRFSSQLLEASSRIQEKLKRHIEQYGVMMALFVLGWGLVAVHHGYKIAQNISEPIERLAEDVVRMRDSSVEKMRLVAIPKNAEWEVINLTDGFNHMIERIRMQWKQLQEKAQVEKELHEKDVENLKITSRLKTSQMQALQRQINPHFLFNTLNVISDTAYLEEAPETRELLSIAAAFLRYSLDNCDKEVTLGRELEALGHYVFLQEKRFGNRIRFEFELNENLNTVHMPALILQPILENAVAHGVGGYLEQAYVRVETSQTEDDMACVCISDNGQGMNREKLDELRRKLDRAATEETMTDGIGMMNVARRLDVFYHGKARMDIESAEGKGTRITLLLPLSMD